MCEEKNVGMYTLQMEAASVVVFPFVQCELVAPLVVDGSLTSKSSCSVGVKIFTGSGSGGFVCICSEELVLALQEGHHRTRTNNTTCALGVVSSPDPSTSQLRMDYITATRSGDVIHPQL